MLGVGDPPSMAWYQGQQAAAQQAAQLNAYNSSENLYLKYMGLARLASPTPSQVPVTPKPEPPDPAAARFSKLDLD